MSEIEIQAEKNKLINTNDVDKIIDSSKKIIKLSKQLNPKEKVKKIYWYIDDLNGTITEDEHNIIKGLKNTEVEINNKIHNIKKFEFLEKPKRKETINLMKLIKN
jgi:hypothetical protein